jgi:hypothetical protein
MEKKAALTAGYLQYGLFILCFYRQDGIIRLEITGIEKGGEDE